MTEGQFGLPDTDDVDSPGDEWDEVDASDTDSATVSPGSDREFSSTASASRTPTSSKSRPASSTTRPSPPVQTRPRRAHRRVRRADFDGQGGQRLRGAAGDDGRGGQDIPHQRLRLPDMRTTSTATRASRASAHDKGRSSPRGSERVVESQARPPGRRPDAGTHRRRAERSRDGDLGTEEGRATSRRCASRTPRQPTRWSASTCADSTAPASSTATSRSTTSSSTTANSSSSTSDRPSRSTTRMPRSSSGGTAATWRTSSPTGRRRHAGGLLAYVREYATPKDKADTAPGSDDDAVPQGTPADRRDDESTSRQRARTVYHTKNGISAT